MEIDDLSDIEMTSGDDDDDDTAITPAEAKENYRDERFKKLGFQIFTVCGSIR